MPTDLQTKKLVRLFALYDVRENGRLERDDYELVAHRIAEACGHELGSADHELVTRSFLTQFERIKAVADRSRDGASELEEWIAFFSLALTDESAFEAVVGDFVSSIFDAFDLDHDSELDAIELCRMRVALGIPDDEGDRLFRALDRDQDGKLGAAEVKRAIEAFFRSDDPSEPGNAFFGPLDP